MWRTSPQLICFPRSLPGDIPTWVPRTDLSQGYCEKTHRELQGNHGQAPLLPGILGIEFFYSCFPHSVGRLGHAFSPALQEGLGTDLLLVVGTVDWLVHVYGSNLQEENRMKSEETLRRQLVLFLHFCLSSKGQLMCQRSSRSYHTWQRLLLKPFSSTTSSLAPHSQSHQQWQTLLFRYHSCSSL